MEQDVCDLQAVYSGEHALLSGLPTLAHGVAASSLRPLLKQCQRRTVLRISRLLPLVDARGLTERSLRAPITRLLADARAALKREAMTAIEKDAAVIRILQELQTHQRDVYRRLQSDAEEQHEFPDAQVFQALADELAEEACLFAEMAAGPVLPDIAADSSGIAAELKLSEGGDAEGRTGHDHSGGMA
jgi:ferritin-like metal-binding protein YciE